jgi:hypothetical protein
LSAIIAILLSTFALPAAAAGNREHGKRDTKSLAGLRAAPAKIAQPAVAASNTQSRNNGLLANFDGVGSLDSQKTNFGLTFEPPDQGLCVGNGFVVEMVNSAFRIYDTHGNTLAGPTNVNAPFHEDFAAFTSDPRCHFDPATNTWFAVVLFINDPGTESTIDIAYNTTGDPRTDWSVFRINTTHANAPASFDCPCFGDQPLLGIDAFNVYTSANEFSILGPEFNGSNVYAISKRDLVRHAKKVHFAQYMNLTIDGEPAASVHPALTYGPAPAEYFLSSLDPKGDGDNRIGVWALTNQGRVDSGGKPQLSSRVISSEPYSIPPGAAQKGSTQLLESGDDRMMETQFINGEIWGALGTKVSGNDDSTPRAGIAWFRVRPQLDGSKLGSASLSAQGYLRSGNRYLLYPAIQADGNGNAAIVFTLTGANMFPSAAYATLSEGQDNSEFGAPVVAAQGSGPYNASPQRWGDYSWAVLDPTSDSVWMATEYMGPKSSQSSNGRRPWGTRVLHLSFQ